MVRALALASDAAVYVQVRTRVFHKTDRFSQISDLSPLFILFLTWRNIGKPAGAVMK